MGLKYLELRAEGRCGANAARRQFRPIRSRRATRLGYRHRGSWRQFDRSSRRPQPCDLRAGLAATLGDWDQSCTTALSRSTKTNPRYGRLALPTRTCSRHTDPGVLKGDRQVIRSPFILMRRARHRDSPAARVHGRAIAEVLHASPRTRSVSPVLVAHGPLVLPSPVGSLAHPLE
jgi:hypothetical protein